MNIALTAAVELTPGEMAPMIFPGRKQSRKINENIHFELFANVCACCIFCLDLE